MTRADFLAALAEKLQGVTVDERDEALKYYNEYLDEAGPDHEEAVIEELGSPQKVANIIIANSNVVPGAAKQSKPQPELTLDGPDYTRTKVESAVRNAAEQAKDSVAAAAAALGDEAPPAPGAGYSQPFATENCGAYQYGGQKNAGSQPNSNRMWLIILIIVTFPIWIGILGGLFGLVAGAAGVLFAAVVSGFALAISGAVCFFASMGLLANALPSALLMMGLSALTLALGAIIGAGTVWCIAYALPWVVKMISGLVRSIFGKRGA